MTKGNGYFYDRNSCKYISIDEHAMDAVRNWKKFRCEKVKNLSPIKHRDKILRYVLAQGFIRVRDYRDHIGWQFHGNSISALRVLRKYIKKHEVGYRTITFTNLETNKQITDNTEAFMNFTFEFIDEEMGDWHLRTKKKYYKEKEKEVKTNDNVIR